jgi:hypothetical protein
MAETDYEKSDIPLKTIGLAALAVAVLLGLGPLTLHLFATGVPDDVARRPTIAPPPPRLETNPPADLKALRAREEEQLTSYGWVDRARGIVHVPIAEAMKRVAAQGLDGFPRSKP